MNIKSISKSDAQKLCLRSESHYYDRKDIRVKAAQIEKICVALANAEGGEIVIGIENIVDSTNPLNAWRGFEEPENCNSYLQAIYNLTPPIYPRYSFFACQGLEGILLAITIDKSSEVHKTSDSTIYIRQGAQSLPIKDPEKIRALTFIKGIASFEEDKVSSVTADDIETSNVLGSFLEDFSPKTEPLDYLLNEYFLDSKTWEPKYASVLLFLKNPAAALPKRCGVKIIRYETREDDPERDHLKETYTVEGSLYNLIHDSMNKINDLLNDVKIWSVDGLKKVSYPPETLWEVLVNSIIHRDYSISDDVQILIFDNRIEVKSPGKLPSTITPQNILSERFSRNPKIVRNLNRYKNPPNKDIGEGLDTAFQKMHDWKLKAPVISEEGNYVVVSIPHIPLARPEEIVIEFLNKNPEITNRQARDLTGIRSENEMKRVFYRLRDDNKIEQVPEKKASASAWRKKI